MSQNKLGLGLMLVSVAAAFGLFFSARNAAPVIEKNVFEPRSSQEAGVEVTVTPRLSAGVLELEVIFDTHSGELSTDVAADSALVDGKGTSYAPVAWDGDPPGGHHRTGVLKFGAIGTIPQPMTLIIKKVGGVDRIFKWSNETLN